MLFASALSSFSRSASSAADVSPSTGISIERMCSVHAVRFGNRTGAVELMHSYY
jgi:hypothetical protein